jgi:hypothetical protein
MREGDSGNAVRAELSKSAVALRLKVRL